MNPQDYQHLIQQLLDGEISARDFARLDEELRQNPEALAAYRLYVGIHCGLVRTGEIDAAVRALPVVPIDRVMAFQRRQLARSLKHPPPSHSSTTAPSISTGAAATSR